MKARTTAGRLRHSKTHRKQAARAFWRGTQWSAEQIRRLATARLSPFEPNRIRPRRWWDDDPLCIMRTAAP